jgi:hypothetical protein
MMNSKIIKKGNDFEVGTNEEDNVLETAVKMLEIYDRTSKISMNMAIHNTKNLLQSFLDEKNGVVRSDKWRIDQYNRNRPREEQVHTIEALDEIIDEWCNE